MRNHRMFNVKLITDDRFMSLPCRVQLLYIQLIAVADDEGFVGNLRMICSRRMYLDQLVSAGLVHIFSTGPALILHWFCHNAVKASHAKETIYTAEKALVTLDNQKIYVLKKEADDSGILPSKEKKSKEKKSKEKEREEKAADAAADRGSLSEIDREKNFLLFWDKYPKKIDREETQKVFMEIQEDFETIMEGLEYHRKCNQWVSDNGTFIPDPKNWLKKKAWSNRPPLYVPKQDAVPNGSEATSGRLGPEELAAIHRALGDPC